MTFTLTDGTEVHTWVVPMWALWTSLALIWLPILTQVGLRFYFRWRLARAMFARGEALNALAKTWGCKRSIVSTGRGLRWETDKELRKRIHDEAST